MSAERRLRLVHPDEAAPDPTEAAVWRRGLASARAALAGGHKRPEVPHAGPEAPGYGAGRAAGGGSFRPLPPDVANAWRVLHGGDQGEAER